MEKFDTLDLNQFHDAKFGSIVYDYRRKIVRIGLDMDSDFYTGPFVFVANEVTFLESKIDELWGKGIYIYKLTVINVDGGFVVNIQLNSGDIIKIKCKDYGLIERKKDNLTKF